jgi:hypothetical protein
VIVIAIQVIAMKMIRATIIVDSGPYHRQIDYMAPLAVCDLSTRRLVLTRKYAASTRDREAFGIDPSCYFESPTLPSA